VTAAVKELVPGSLSFLLAGLAGGTLLLFGSPRAARWGRGTLVALLALYLALSLQGTSDLLVLGLSHGYASLRTAADARGARIVVVLSNGMQMHHSADGELAVVNLQTGANAIEAARLYRLLDGPRLLASGGATDPYSVTAEGDVLRSALERLGVPSASIEVERGSWTTYEQAVNAVAWLRARDNPPFVLVTAPEHMRRVMGVFAARGVHPIPSMSRLRYGGPPFWRPTKDALTGSKAAVYEYLALALYWKRGWLDASHSPTVPE
jgi:uncharacterized SAM-binding protein YcdF (DUF218 family)